MQCLVIFKDWNESWTLTLAFVLIGSLSSHTFALFLLRLRTNNIDKLMRTSCIAFSALWWPKWEINPKKKIHTHTHIYIMTQLVKNPPTMQKIRIWSVVGKIPWRRKWQPTPVFLSGEFHGQRNLVGYSPWGCRELYVSSLSLPWLIHLAVQ